MITQVIVSIERDDGADFEIKMEDMMLEDENIESFFTAMGPVVKNTPKLSGADDGESAT